MILEIQHETRLNYPEPVTESITEVRMEPVSDADQSCRSFHLAVSPPPSVFRYQDGFGNRVHHFNVLAPHVEVRILAASVVETHPRPRDLAASQAAYPLDAGRGRTWNVLDFLQPARPGPAARRAWTRCWRSSAAAAGHARWATWSLAVSRYIHDALRVRPRRDPGQLAHRRRAANRARASARTSRT